MAVALRDSSSQHRGVVGKLVGEVVGVEEDCFEVTGRRGTHHGGCSIVMAVGRREALVRGRAIGRRH
jgi:hypothetical protein